MQLTLRQIRGLLTELFELALVGSPLPLVFRERLRVARGQVPPPDRERLVSPRERGLPLPQPAAKRLGIGSAGRGVAMNCRKTCGSKVGAEPNKANCRAMLITAPRRLLKILTTESFRAK